MRLRLKICSNDDGFLCEIHRVENLSPFLTKKLLISVLCMPREELFELLVKLRFHERDILDAFDEAEDRSVDPRSELGQLLEELDNASEHPKDPWYPSIDITNNLG